MEDPEYYYPPETEYQHGPVDGLMIFLLILGSIIAL